MLLDKVQLMDCFESVLNCLDNGIISHDKKRFVRMVNEFGLVQKLYAVYKDKYRSERGVAVVALFCI